MALIKRFARLFQSDIHAVLDRIEDPESLLKHSIREMEEDLRRDALQAKLLAREREQVIDQIAGAEQSLVQFAEELDICFESGKDDLARSLIRRQLESKQISIRFSSQEVSLVKSQTELNTRIEENGSLLDAMKQKAELVTTDHGADDYRGTGDVVNVHPAISDEDVEVAFLCEQKRRGAQ